MYIYIDILYILFSPFIFLSSDICLSMHHRASTRDPGKQILHDSGHIEASNKSYTILSYLHSAQINVLSFCCKRRAPASANCASRQTWRRNRPELTQWCTSLHRTSNNRRDGSNGDKCRYFSFFWKYVEFESWTYRCSEFHPMPRTWMSN